MSFVIYFYFQCSLDMEFFNPNIAAEMAQILKNYQQKYVPKLAGEERDVIASVPVHGDQLFEERSRNVQWTFRDGANEYDRLEGLTTEHADWHAKVTLYKASLKLICCKVESKTVKITTDVVLGKAYPYLST